MQKTITIVRELHELKCQNPQCGKTFQSVQDYAKYCSDACRQKVYRHRKDAQK